MYFFNWIVERNGEDRTSTRRSNCRKSSPRTLRKKLLSAQHVLHLKLRLKKSHEKLGKPGEAISNVAATFNFRSMLQTRLAML